MSSRLSRLVLFVRGQNDGLAKAASFYSQTLGLPLLRLHDTGAELDAGPHVTLHLQVADTEAQLSTSSSPLIMLETKSSLPETVAACLQAGAHLDGPMQYPAHGSIATLRTPDGHMIGLYEPAKG